MIVLALVVLAAGPRSALNRVLFALLLLRGASDFFYEQMRVASTFEESMVELRIANWYDFPTLPLTLLLLYLLFPPTRARTGWVIAFTAGLLVTAAVTAALVFEPSLLAIRHQPDIRPQSHGLWLPFVYIVAGFAAQALGIYLAARKTISPRASALQRRQSALVGMAFAILLINAAGLGIVVVQYAAVGLAYPAPATATRLATVLCAILVARSLRLIANAFEGRSRRMVVATLLLALLTGIADGSGVLLDKLGLSTGERTSLRFVCVAASAACLALALVRFGLAGLSETSRPRVAAVALGALAFGALVLPAGIVFAMMGGNSVALVAGLFLLLGAVAFAPAPRHVVTAALGRVLFLDPHDPRAVGERARIYSEALAIRAGAPTEVNDAPLQALRVELGLSERDHTDLALMVAQHSGQRASEPLLLGRYHVERELGRGASGTALLATDVGTSGKVVLKRFHTGVVEERALAEARALTAVRHPNVVSLLAVERVGGEIFLVLAYAEGGTAEALIARDGPLPPERAVAIVQDVLAGLDAIHTAGLAHGDVKTANILLDRDERALLTDLGSARSTERESSDLTLTASPFVGTYATLAPELLRGGRRSHEGDIYAVGAVLYRLLTGSHYVDIEGKDPLSAAEVILHEPPRLPHPRVPEALEAFLARALAKDPATRFTSAREASAVLAAD